MKKTFAQSLAESGRNVRVIYVSSYIPRECGIATFTKDLTSSINVLNPLYLSEIVAVDVTDPVYDYPWEVKFRFEQDNPDSYIAAAKYVNQSSTEIVMLEHEFGLYGPGSGGNIVDFLSALKKPVVTTFHTVLRQPSEEQKLIMQAVAKCSKAVVVMVNAAADRLASIYDIDRQKIVVIPHGVPDIPFTASSPLLSKKGKNNLVLSTFGLINKSKGIEYAIRALPEIIKRIPNVRYLVLGETHPVIRRTDGEKYRQSLEKLVRQLKLAKHVHFENRFLSLDELIDYLQATDIYITPYLNPEQITSGTLAYAVGAGLPCVSTPYIYAQELLDETRGLLVNYKNPRQIARAVIKLATNDAYRDDVRQSAYQYGRQMTWDNVALKHLDLFKSVIEASKN